MITLQNATASQCLKAFWHHIGRTGRALVVLFFLLVALAAVVVVRHHRVTILDPWQASVNGDPIRMSEMFSAMDYTCGREVLTSLVEEKLVIQEAKRQNVTVSDAEFKPRQEEIDGQHVAGPIREMLLQRARAALLLRKLLLRDVPESKLRHLYDLFHDEMAEYQVSHISTASLVDAQKVLAELRHGSTFDVMASTRSLDASTRNTGGALGYLSASTLLRSLGVKDAATVMALQPGQLSSPIRVGLRYHIFKMGQRRTSYQDVKTLIEDRIVTARRPLFLRQLIARASIVQAGAAAPVVVAPLQASSSPGLLRPEASSTPELQLK
ncbi:MAG: peptidylprolyl isomerase [Candidatus Xenobia bacterium]